MRGLLLFSRCHASVERGTCGWWCHQCSRSSYYYYLLISHQPRRIPPFDEFAQDLQVPVDLQVAEPLAVVVADAGLEARGIRGEEGVKVQRQPVLFGGAVVEGRDGVAVAVAVAVQGVVVCVEVHVGVELVTGVGRRHDGDVVVQKVGGVCGHG